jgi:hypothetical protein
VEGRKRETKIMEKKYKKEMNHDRMKEKKLGTKGELRDEK